MSTNMLEQDRENRDFEKVVGLLTPKFPRKCEFSFKKPYKRLINLVWGIGGIAAMLVVVLTIAIRSATTVSASEVINSAFVNFDDAETVKVEFVFNSVARTPKEEVYRPDSDGVPVDGTLYLLRRDGNVYVRVDWHDAEKNSVVLNGNDYVHLQNNSVVEKHPSSFGKELIELINLKTMTRLLNDDLKTSSEGNRIIAESKKESVTLRGEFDIESKQLVRASVVATGSDGKSIPLFETQSIETGVEIPEAIFSVY